jgi:uncharacterized protein YegJ (DUF2314 family)
MFKTLLHVVVALALWFILRAFDIGIAWRLGAIVIGAIGVHYFWEWFVFDPYLYLGVMYVPDDDPVMLRAREKACDTLPQFFESIYPQYREDSMVKFRFETSSGGTEYLWGDLLEVKDDQLQVYLRTPPETHEESLDRNMAIGRDRIVDWQVARTDGTILGSYTTRALFTIFEREEGYLHPKLRKQLSRFRDLDSDTCTKGGTSA